MSSLRRELAIVFRARVTWAQAALSALLVGHGFVLAVDLYTAGSRSVRASALMAREFDPLAGIVRPTLGGLYLALSLLGPIVAARPLAIEKERRTLQPLLLLTAAPARVIGAKFVAALLGVGLQLVAPLLLLGVWLAVGGHLAFAETAAALVGYALYLALVVALGTAAAAWTRSLAQAVTVGLLVIAASWAIDASEGFAALAWLGRALDWSVSTHLLPMERGTAAVGACGWLAAVASCALVVAWIGARHDWRPARRGPALLLVVAAGASAAGAASRVVRQYDLTEDRRASLPPAVVAGLRDIRAPIWLDVLLDRDDSRRGQLESDLLARLRLARPDARARFPLDARERPGEAERDQGYGRIVIHVGERQAETFSTSRREIVTLVFETAGRPAPDWTRPEYPGYPLVVEGRRRSVVLVVAYAGLPLLMLAFGWLATRSRRRT